MPSAFQPVGGLGVEWMLVDEESAAGGEWFTVEPLAVAGDVEGQSGWVAGEGAPTDIDMSVGVAEGDDTSVERVLLGLFLVIAGLTYGGQAKCEAE